MTFDVTSHESTNNLSCRHIFGLTDLHEFASEFFLDSNFKCYILFAHAPDGTLWVHICVPNLFNGFFFYLRGP